MRQATVRIPEEALFGTGTSVAEAEEFARLMTALGYYTRKGVSAGRCAQIAVITEEDFMLFLGDNGVSVFSFRDEDELARELANA